MRIGFAALAGWSLLMSSAHGAGLMLAAMAVVAIVVYEKVGLGILRRGWFNLDLGWSLVLVGSGAVTLFSS
jgi:hypothetical protein